LLVPARSKAVISCQQPHQRSSKSYPNLHKNQQAWLGRKLRQQETTHGQHE